MTYKIARAEQHGKVLWLHFEGNKQRYKAWLDAPFSKDLVVGAEAEATFTTTPGKEVPDKPGEHYPDEIFIETWGGVSGALPKKNYGGGGGKAAAPKPEYETLSVIAASALNAAIATMGPDASIQAKDGILPLANKYFDAMLGMCQRGKGKLERQSAPQPGATQQPAKAHQNGSPNPAPESKSAFGYQPQRWPPQSYFGEPTTDKQRKIAADSAKKRDVAEEIYEPLRRAVLQAYGIGITPSRGSLSLFIDWLMQASDVHLDAGLSAAANPPEQFSEAGADTEPLPTADIAIPDDPRSAYLWIAEKLEWPGYSEAGPQVATAFLKVIHKRVLNPDELTREDWLTLYKFALSVQADPSLEPLAFQTWKEQRAKAKEGVGV